jgi:hypothetical protein
MKRIDRVFIATSPSAFAALVEPLAHNQLCFTASMVGARAVEKRARVSGVVRAHRRRAEWRRYGFHNPSRRRASEANAFCGSILCRAMTRAERPPTAHRKRGDSLARISSMHCATIAGWAPSLWLPRSSRTSIRPLGAA